MRVRIDRSDARQNPRSAILVRHLQIRNQNLAWAA
jgi:hypothetical protein